VRILSCLPRSTVPELFGTLSKNMLWSGRGYRRKVKLAKSGGARTKKRKKGSQKRANQARENLSSLLRSCGKDLNLPRAANVRHHSD